MTRLTDEIRTETDTLTTEYQNVETRLRAAMVAEDADRQAAELRGGGDDADAETRELRSLQGRASLGRYLQGFAHQEQLQGAERELAEARSLEHVRQRAAVGRAATAPRRRPASCAPTG